MSTGRLSIARLMLVIAIIAINIAAARAILPDHIEILVGVALMWLGLQIALVRMFDQRGERQAFWAGFLVFGFLAISSYVWAMMFPSTLLVTPGGPVIETPGSPVYPIWNGYLGLLISFLEGMVGRGADKVAVLALGLILMIVWIALPQGVTAISGGFLFRRIFRLWLKRIQGGSLVTPGVSDSPLAHSSPSTLEISPTAAASPLRRRST